MDETANNPTDLVNNILTADNPLVFFMRLSSSQQKIVKDGLPRIDKGPAILANIHAFEKTRQSGQERAAASQNAEKIAQRIRQEVQIEAAQQRTRK